MNKEEILKYLDWYFYNDNGCGDKNAIKKYEELKEFIKNLEQYNDKFCKVIIYLLRKYKYDLMTEFKDELHWYDEEYFNLIEIFEKIAAEMNEEMPELWYIYGFGSQPNS